jgi:hypothetical protein
LTCAVYLTYAAPGGHALIDRQLYLPRSWTGDPVRCRAAGIPDGTVFAIKPALARWKTGHNGHSGAHRPSLSREQFPDTEAGPRVTSGLWDPAG